MPSYPCPKGHQSTESDFCSECGAKIQGVPNNGSQAAAPAPAPAASADPTCPDCGAPVSTESPNFCEVCGYNFTTGAHGELPVAVAASAPAPAAAPTAATPATEPAPAEAAPVDPKTADRASYIAQQQQRAAADQPASTPSQPSQPSTASDGAPPRASQSANWEAVVTIDPALRDPASPDPPADFAPINIHLDKEVTLVGRKSNSRAIFPEIALDFDTAVSHRHALLTRDANGGLTLRDIGSSNGTRLNGKDLASMTDAPIHDGDEITLGHWTKVTVKAG